MRLNNPNTVVAIHRAILGAQSGCDKKAQAREIAGKIEKTKAQQFAEYIEECFISICEDLHVFEMARDWAKKSEFEKLTVADNIIKRFVAHLKSDVRTGRAKKYNNMSAESMSDEAVPNIFVARAQDGLMSVSLKGWVNINPNWSFYSDLTRFLMDLRHEATHIVDIFFPELSPLDFDILVRAQLFYVDGHDDFGLYESNPLELNANTRRREFGDIVRAKIALCEYNRIRGMAGNGMGSIIRGR